MIKILFLASNPDRTNPLQLDEEVRSITQKIRASQYRDTLNLISAFAVRPDDLLQMLNEHKPQIVHFSGHGSETGEIILMDSNRRPKPVSTLALETLFATLKDNIRVVLLNSCYSKIQAEAIVEVVGCVIGANAPLGDEAAGVFASSFYRAIGFGRSISEAFEQGKTSLLLEGIPESSKLELLVGKGIDPSKLILVEPTDEGIDPRVKEPRPTDPFTIYIVDQQGNQVVVKPYKFPYGDIKKRQYTQFVQMLNELPNYCCSSVDATIFRITDEEIIYEESELGVTSKGNNGVIVVPQEVLRQGSPFRQVLERDMFQTSQKNYDLILGSSDDLHVVFLYLKDFIDKTFRNN